MQSSYNENEVGFIIASTRNGFCARNLTCFWKIRDDRFSPVAPS